MIFISPENLIFPHPFEADDNGILCFGGDLSYPRLFLAYKHGIFPWYSEGEPIIWWFPNPRCVLFPDQLKVHKSMRSYFNQNKYTVTFDTVFLNVIKRCRSIKRQGQDGTWLTDEMISAYHHLHQKGIAHSVEVWKDDELVGGLYGVAMGKIFYGESMFADAPNASKFGFIKMVSLLKSKNFKLIDCQQDTPHMRTLGAETIPSEDFYMLCQENHSEPVDRSFWTINQLE